MKYISPFRITNATDSSIVAETLANIKKNALEMLEKQPSVNIGDVVMNKNEVLATFHELAKTENFPMHEMIAREATLLDFLENGKIPVQDYTVGAAQYDPKFLAFVSPYFCAQLKNKFSYFLSNNSFHDAANLLKIKPLMTSSDTEAHWQNVTQALEGRKAIVDNFSKILEENGVVNESEAKPFYGVSMLRLMEQLPAERFLSFNDAYAKSINNLAVHRFKKGASYEAEDALVFASKLKLSPEMENAIANQLDYLRGEINKTASKADYGSSGGGIGAGGAISVIILILAIIRLMVTLSRCNSYSSRELPPSYNQYDMTRYLAEERKEILEPLSEGDWETFVIKAKPVEEKVQAIIKNKKKRNDATEITNVTNKIRKMYNQQHGTQSAAWALRQLRILREKCAENDYLEQNYDYFTNL
jgi:hypothetical protein